MSLSFKEVAEIMKIIDNSSCEEVVLEAEGIRLVVRRGAGGSVPSASQVTTASPAASTAAPEVVPSALRSSSAAAAGGAGTLIEKAPMVGTFFRRPSPDEAPFVEVGSKVSSGGPLCIIEVMKLYTTITASVTGVVDAILVEDAALVEFDQPLFIIRPT